VTVTADVIDSISFQFDIPQTIGYSLYLRRPEHPGVHSKTHPFT